MYFGNGKCGKEKQVYVCVCVCDLVHLKIFLVGVIGPTVCCVYVICLSIKTSVCVCGGVGGLCV